MKQKTASKKKKKNKVLAPAPANKSFIDSKNILLGLLGLFILLFFLIRLHLLEIPFERDDGLYSLFGRLILEGKTPYLDFYVNKPPLLFYSYAVLVGLFGATISGVHLSFYLINAFTAYLIYLLGKQLYSRQLGVFSALSFLVLSYSQAISGFTAQSENLVILLAVPGWYFLLKGLEQKKFNFLISGALLASSMWIKQNGLFFLALAYAILVLIRLFESNINWKRMLTELAYLSLGALIPTLLLFGTLFVQGAFGQFIFWTFEYAYSFITTVSLEQGYNSFMDAVMELNEGYTLFHILGILGLVGLFQKRWSPRLKIIMSIAFAFSFLSFIPGLRFYTHYFITFLPAWCILIGMGVFNLGDVLKMWIPQYKTVVFSLFLGLMVFTIYQHRSYYFNPDPTEVLRATYGFNPFPESKIIADYINERSTETDQMVVLGSEPQIYFYTNLKSPSRHRYTEYLSNPTPLSLQFQKELMADVEREKPKYILYFNHQTSWALQSGTHRDILDWINAYVFRQYEIIGISDIDPNSQKAVYLWEDQIKGYKPITDSYCYILRLKS